MREMSPSVTSSSSLSDIFTYDSDSSTMYVDDSCSTSECPHVSTYEDGQSTPNVTERSRSCARPCAEFRAMNLGLTRKLMDVLGVNPSGQTFSGTIRNLV
ncbi:hypothetical protein SprV_0702329200 [Sparganum proliferum]